MPVPMQCACLRDDGLDCAQTRYGRHADEPCDCSCHYPEPEGWEEAWFHDLTEPPMEDKTDSRLQEAIDKTNAAISAAFRK